MPDGPLISYARNGEDVVLWRALGDIQGGVYVDVIGGDESSTRLFHDRGWRGVVVVPQPELAEQLRDRRPHDEVVHAVLDQTGAGAPSTLDGVLSDSGVATEPLHFLAVGADRPGPVLGALDLDRWRPWVLVVRSSGSGPGETHEEWEPMVLAAGYRLVLFDGVSRFYVGPDHPELSERLSYPACSLDGFERVREVELRATVEAQREALSESREQVLRWRREAVDYWVDAVSRVQKTEEAAEEARADALRLRRQLARNREQLKEIREDRRRLRARVNSLSERVEALEQRDREGAGLTRLRSAAKKIIRE